MIRAAVLTSAFLLALAPAPALAWGNMGHRIVGEAAMRALPGDVPAFLRTPGSVRDVGELSREQDRSKGSGRIHDHNRDAGHFLDLDEEGKLLGGPPFLPLPATRADYEKALQAAGIDSWKAGYLPYSIVDQHQQLAKDFGYWRVLSYAAARERNKIRKAWLRRDLARRETQILATLGHLSHFVGDGSQPLHVTVHYNGWGEYPNPNGYTTAKVHGPFESEFVFANIDPLSIDAKMTAPVDCKCPVEQRTTNYLTATSRFVVPFYEMEKAGGLRPGDPRGVAFASERLAAGASELRDMVVSAWKASARVTVGWPVMRVDDVLSGKVDPYDALYGKD